MSDTLKKLNKFLKESEKIVIEGDDVRDFFSRENSQEIVNNMVEMLETAMINEKKERGNNEEIDEGGKVLVVVLFVLMLQKIGYIEIKI